MELIFGVEFWVGFSLYMVLYANVYFMYMIAILVCAIYIHRRERDRGIDTQGFRDILDTSPKRPQSTMGISPLQTMNYFCTLAGSHDRRLVQRTIQDN